jgi:iron uptake system component EfeO
MNRAWIGRRGAVVLVTVGLLATAGCGSSTPTAAPAASPTAGALGGTAAASGVTSSAGSSATAPGEVTVTITDADGCVASPDTVPAGPVTFVVTNVDALGVTEVELVSDQRIVGERENLAPGFDSTFSARLDGGS